MAAVLDGLLASLKDEFKSIRGGSMGVIRTYCVVCDNVITDKQVITFALNQPYHAEHFVCSTCHTPLVNTKYFADDKVAPSAEPGDEPAQPRYYCDSCYNATVLVKCSGCGKSIHSQELRHKELVFHPECFGCSICKKSLAHESFIEQPGDTVCCVSCYEIKSAPTCLSCELPIKSGTPASSFGTGEKKKTFHKACLKCKVCSKGAPEVVVRLAPDGSILCNAHLVASLKR